jgi:hypothetical protein
LQSEIKVYEGNMEINSGLDNNGAIAKSEVKEGTVEEG